MIVLKRLRRRKILTKASFTKDEVRRFSRYMDEKLRRADKKAKKARGENFVDPKTIILD